MEILAVSKVESLCLLEEDVYKSSGSGVSGTIRLEKFFPAKYSFEYKSNWPDTRNRDWLKKQESIFNYDFLNILIIAVF